MRDVIDERLRQMKEEALEKAKAERVPLHQRLQWTYRELVRRHVEQQRAWGVAVPSQREAEEEARRVCEQLAQEMA